MHRKTLQKRVQQKKRKKDQPTTNNNKRYRFKHTRQNNKTCENCDPMTLELSYIQNTQQRKAWPQSGRESTLTAIHTCNRPRIPFGHVLIEHRCVIKHCKRGCNKETKDQTHHKQQKGTVSKTQNQKNKTCETYCDPMKFELSYSNTQQGKAWPQRESTCTLTVIHPCHRTRIPFGHVLIERRCVIKHCMRGCNKEKKDQPTTNNNKDIKVPFQ
jgi:hypothetical protein